MEKRQVGIHVVLEEPPYRVRNARGRSIGHPDLKRAEVVLSRAEVDGLHTVIGPCASVGWGVPGQYLRTDRRDGMLLEVVQASR
jgi:hypothetical protein